MTFLGIPQIDDRIEPIPHCGCWIWLGHVNSRGYGKVKMKGRDMYVHHIAWRKYNKRPIPKGRVLMHSCDTRRCCNPDHLKPGTHRANMRDMVRKGRAASRSNGRHASCKLGFRVANDLSMEHV